MQSFRTLDDADVKGKRVLVRVDLNVPMDDGKVADATRIEEIAPTITELAGKGGKVILLSHLNRPKGRDPKEFAQARRRRGRADRQTAGGLCRGLRRGRRRAGGRRHEERRHSLSGKHPLSSRGRKERQGLRQSGSPRSAIFSSTTLSRRRIASMPPSTAIVTVSNLPAYPGRAMQAELDALERAFEHPQHPVTAIVGGAKDLDQARSARPSDGQGRDADHRRRHGQHVSRRARQSRRQIALRDRPRADRARHHGQGQSAAARDRAAGRRRGGAKARRPRPDAASSRSMRSAQPT